MRSKRVLVVLVGGMAGLVAFAAATAISSSGQLAGPPVTYNSAGEPVIRSPNGQYSITVGNSGIQLSGPAGARAIFSGTSLWDTERSRR